jgi:Putative prokaryotic signal transducing protein
MKTQSILICNSAVEAHLIKGRLMNEGIPCFLINENISTLLPFYQNMLGGGIHIFVNECDVEMERELLVDEIKPDPELKLKTCPDCGSNQIAYRIAGNRFYFYLVVFLSLLTWIPFNNLKPSFKCKDCGTEF